VKLVVPAKSHGGSQTLGGEVVSEKSGAATWLMVVEETVTVDVVVMEALEVVEVTLDVRSM
jgi:hypothetical protein